MNAQVKCFDEEHEKDLELAVNKFLSTIPYDDLIDIKYAISHFDEKAGQIYSYSAMVIYKTKKA